MEAVTAYLAECALANSSEEIEMKEGRLAIVIDLLGAAVAHRLARREKVERK
jgi:hypothetical protein